MILYVILIIKCLLLNMKIFFEFIILYFKNILQKYSPITTNIIVICMLSDILFILLKSLFSCLIFRKSSLLVIPIPLLNLSVCYCIRIFVHLFLLFVSPHKLLSPFLSIIGYYYWVFLHAF